MFARSTKILMLVALAVVMAVGSASASIYSVEYAMGTPGAYDLETAFLLGSSTSQTETFEGFATNTTAPQTLAVGGITGYGYVGDPGTAQAPHDEYAASGDKYWSNGTVGSAWNKGDFTINVTNKANSVGFFAIDLQDKGGTVWLTVVSADGTQQINLMDTVGAQASGSLAYIALYGDAQVNSITFHKSGGDGYAVDNISTAQTPIPGAVLLFGSGLLGLLGYRRRLA